MRFFGALVAIVLAAVLQLRGTYLGHSTPDFVLTALFAFAVLLEFWEMLVLVLVALFLLAWQPAPSLELLWFAVLPFLGLGVRNLGLERWAAHLITASSGLALFYALVDPRFMIRNAELFGQLWIMGILWSVAVFHLYRSAFMREAAAR